MDGNLFERVDPDEVAKALGAEEVPADPVVRFLNRWAFNWRGERAVIEKELRELIARKDA